MGAPIRSSTEITLIINRAQHAIGDLGQELIEAAKRGDDATTSEDFRDNMYRLILLRIQLQNILDQDGNVVPYYDDPDNEKLFNRILDGVARLSQFYAGTSIPLITGNRIPLYFFPSTAGLGSGGNTNSGSGEATPGGTTFENLSVDTPGELVDSFDASSSNFALFTYSAYGSNSGEGSRSGMILASIRGATATLFEVKTPDNGGITSPLTFSAAIVDGMFELTADVTTDGWLIRGVRILFQNITFQNPLGPLPTGGSANQLLSKISGTDYDVEWKTLVWAMITDITASLTEINYVNGVTSPVQDQLDAMVEKAGDTMNGDLAMGGSKVTGLGAATTNGDALRYEQLIGLYLLLAGGTMAGNIAMGGNKVTGLGAATSNGEAIRYEQLINAYLLLTGGTMAGNIAMGGNKVTGLGAATTNGDAVRYEQLFGFYLLLTGGTITGTLEVQGGVRTQTTGPYLKTKVIDIGDWNMVTTAGVAIAHGIDHTKIRGPVQAVVRNDGATAVFPLGVASDGTGTGAYISSVDATNVNIDRVFGGIFDTTDFNATSYNRGWITIQYEA